MTITPAEKDLETHENPTSSEGTSSRDGDLSCSTGTKTGKMETNENEDDRKIFLTRIPSDFDQDTIKRILQEYFGDGSVQGIYLVSSREGRVDTESLNETHASTEEETKSHRGFAFVVMSTTTICKRALEKGTVRGSQKMNSKKKHTMYIRSVVRENDINGVCDDIQKQKDICYLWANFRCPYGPNCKFRHDGEGGLLEKNRVEKKKKTKVIVIKEAKDKDCINWKTKGKCRKGEKCPYKHDEAVREAFLKKKEKKSSEKEDSKKKRQRRANPQPLSVRVFGLNYETTENDVREYFKHCGPIREITFPVFGDSGRSKGYCGVLFTSPKATEKACLLNGEQLHGRWLSVQAGKMYLKQWAERERIRTVEADIGEFGQKVKRRKKHGFKDEER